MSSVTSYADRQDHCHLYKKPSNHRRNNSGELDVFEAANYFSSASNNMTINEHHQPAASSSHKSNKENITSKSYKLHQAGQAGRPKGGRMSLDVVGRASKLKVHDDVQVVKENKMIKNYKQQPSSPGGRLASFLNSLFNHSSGSKKKTSKLQDDQLKPRMRRSSISHLDTSRSLYVSASATGFRTPPPVYKTFFDDSKSLQDHKSSTTRSKSSIELLDQRPKISNESFLVSGFDKCEKISTNGVGEKDKFLGDTKITFEFKKVDNSVNKVENNNTVKHFEFRKHIKDDEEDGDDRSDTSSDLFELPNYDLGEFPSELPVYETTNVGKIKNSAKQDNL